MSYEQFIKKAFIDPIRSVLMVDDDYPTYDDILGQGADSYSAGSSEKGWTRDSARLRSQIRKFREGPYPRLVDIHDGANVTTGDEKKIASHLHQTDLLILDYQLDRSRSEDGSQAISILRSLMRNNHFNLVVVYTSLDLDVVFDSIRLGMLGPLNGNLAQEDKTEAENLIEDGEADDEGFGGRLRESVGAEQYLHWRKDNNKDNNKYLRTMVKGEEKSFQSFRDLCLSTWKVNQRKIALRYLLEQFENERRAELNDETPSGLDWSCPSSITGIRWVRTDSVFVAFCGKSRTDDLFSILLESLNDWKPDPSRLFLTKIRASMDEYGVVNQAGALKRRGALALWYEKLLSAKDTERASVVAESVSRHSDRLMETILPHVICFAERLVGDEPEDSPVVRAGARFGVDLYNDDERRQATLFHNAFVCSRQPEGWHLSTGHIFVMDEETWICLSPACDMVPNQISEARVEELGPRLRFMAVRLRPVSGGKLPKDVNSGRYVFWEDGDAVKVFRFNPHTASSAPDWNVLYAEDRGKFSGSDFRFTAIRIERDEVGRITGVPRDAQVVAQLRYEYALNLVQKLGDSLTRIGLDFAHGRGAR